MLLVRLITVALLLCLVQAAGAVTPLDLIKVTWSPVTLNTDGTAAVITGYRLEYGQQDFSHTVTTTGTQLTLDPLSLGQWQMRAIAIASYGESAPSSVVTLLVSQPQVSSPTAYTLVKQTNKFVFVPVGTVPVGTPCDVTQRANEMTVVPRASVTFTGTVRPVVVLALCH